MPEGKKQFYTNVLRAASVEVGQRRDRKAENELILKWAEKNGKILEIGSNLGYFTGRVAKETGSKVVGIDTNTSRLLYKIAHLRNKNTGASFVQGDQDTGLAFQNESFDQVIMSHVIEHFDDPTPLIDEIKRVLKKDGTIIVAVPREEYLGQNTKDHRVKYDSVGQLRKQLEPYGFELVEEKDFGIRESALVFMRKTDNKNRMDINEYRKMKLFSHDPSGLANLFNNENSFDNVRYGLASGDLSLDFESYGRALLEAANRSKGSEKLKYARAINRMGVLMGSPHYQEMLRKLMTHPERINELLDQGLAEMNPLTKIKKLFKE